MTLTEREGISLSNKFREAGMENVRRYRAMGSLCRQQAAYNPAQKWHLLAQAERWEHLAEEELAGYFKACNTASSSDLADTGKSPNANDTRWQTIVAA